MAEVAGKLGFTQQYESKSMVVEMNKRIHVITVPPLVKIDPGIALKTGRTKKFRFVQADRISDTLQVPVGAVSPFGYGADIFCFVSRECLVQEYFHFNPGRHDVTIRIKAASLDKLAGAELIRLF
jgi:prolyl-tRNA editing enzyme YbaK/EbsC (Cys-tRNA(Pro) deacylase)